MCVFNCDRSNINRTRDLNRMANAFYDTTNVSPERRAEDLKRVSLATWAFVRSMKRHLSPEEEDEEAFQLELREKLPRDQAEMILAAAHRKLAMHPQGFGTECRLQNFVEVTASGFRDMHEKDGIFRNLQ